MERNDQWVAPAVLFPTSDGSFRQSHHRRSRAAAPAAAHPKVRQTGVPHSGAAICRLCSDRHPAPYKSLCSPDLPQQARQSEPDGPSPAPSDGDPRDPQVPAVPQPSDQSPPPAFPWIMPSESGIHDPINFSIRILGGAPESPGTALLSHEEYPHQPIPPHSIKLSAFQRKFLPGIFAEYSVSRRRKSVSAGQGFDYFFSARCEKPPARSDNHTSVHHCWTPSPRAISRSDRTAIVTQNHPPAIIFREPCQHLSGPLRMLRVRFEHWAKRLNRRKMQDRIDRLGGSKSLGCNGCS